jgi:hypothetical protein
MQHPNSNSSLDKEKKMSKVLWHPKSPFDKNMLKHMLQLTTSQFAIGIFKHAKSVLIVLLPPSLAIEIFVKKIKRYVLPCSFL